MNAKATVQIQEKRVSLHPLPRSINEMTGRPQGKDQNTENIFFFAYVWHHFQKNILKAIKNSCAWSGKFLHNALKE